MKPVRTMLTYWGVPWIRSYGISVQAMNWAGVSVEKKEKIAKDMSKLANVLSKNRKTSIPLKTRLLFCMFASMQKAGWGSGVMEKEYWEKQGWLGKERPWKTK